MNCNYKLILILLIIKSTKCDEINWTKYLRKLIGSNCIIIEKGVVPRYYQCSGCNIDEALGCINDLRLNKSLNVAPNCNMEDLRSSYQSQYCCPQYGLVKYKNTHRLDLLYTGSAYPEALRCLQFIGCGSSSLYNELLNECESVCPISEYPDARDGTNACYSNFNSSYRLINNNLYILIIINIIIISIYFISFK